MVLKAVNANGSTAKMSNDEDRTMAPSMNDDPAQFQQIYCSGTPYETGHTHGTQARPQVHRTIAFYAAMFQRTSNLDWTHVRETAMEYEPTIRTNWPEYLEEMTGLADGAGVELADIVACNVRTEIAFGLWSDGCTAFSWTPPPPSSASPRPALLAQNWDWETAQKRNLIVLSISQPPKPTIRMVTEAGLIGKIGLNSAGVGVCLNAIRVRGADPTRMPCHLALRKVLDSESRVAARAAVERWGVASSCHMLVADAEGSEGWEWSSVDLRVCEPNERGQVFHTNHYLERHREDVVDSKWLEDSEFRVERVRRLVGALGERSEWEGVRAVLCDEDGYPGSVCRGKREGSEVETLFGIVMDLRAKRAEVVVGRPVRPEGRLVLEF